MLPFAFARGLCFLSLASICLSTASSVQILGAIPAEIGNLASLEVLHLKDNILNVSEII